MTTTKYRKYLQEIVQIKLTKKGTDYDNITNEYMKRKLQV